MKLAAAKKVVEVGTLVGYSAIGMARALPPDGHLWSVEFDAEARRRRAREHRGAPGSPIGSPCSSVPGVDVLPTLEKNGPFDAVFIDADKENYDRYGKWAVANLRPGGLVHRRQHVLVRRAAWRTASARRRCARSTSTSRRRASRCACRRPTACSSA